MIQVSTSNENILNGNILTNLTNVGQQPPTTNGTISITSKSFPTTKSTPAICSDNLLNNEEENNANNISIKSNNSTMTSKTKKLKSSTPHHQQPTSQLCMRSRSLELNGLALWNKRVNYISLCKSERGLGFSLIDYQQDPFNPLSKTMIVVRALVPNGVAQLDGRLMPGQRLVS